MSLCKSPPVVELVCDQLSVGGKLNEEASPLSSCPLPQREKKPGGFQQETRMVVVVIIIDAFEARERLIGKGPSGES